MISPWEIYWVMQLDSIRGALTIIAVSLVVASIVAAFKYDSERSLRDIWADSPGEYGQSKFNEYDSHTRSAGRALRKSLIFALSAMCLAALIPSSRTAAAMIVIPAIANNERFQAEAGDLYQLAKQGLQKLVADEKEDKPAAE